MRRSASSRGRLPASLPMGLTLTELLVVVGIAATLALLLFTGGMMVKRRTDLVRCQANLYQLGIAVNMYITDCGTLPLVYYTAGGTDCPRRPPCPPPDHDLAMVIGDYVQSPGVLECPVTRRFRPGWGYHFNATGAGLKPSQIKTPKHRAMIICDRFDWDHATRRGQGGRVNALFLDGHVKAYRSIGEYPLWLPNPDSGPHWPRD